jgi:hypothetical protein
MLRGHTGLVPYNISRDVRVGDVTVEAVSFSVNVVSVPEERRPRPGARAAVEYGAVLEILGLIASGEVTAEQALGDLERLGHELDEQNTEFDFLDDVY